MGGITEIAERVRYHLTYCLFVRLRLFFVSTAFVLILGVIVVMLTKVMPSQVGDPMGWPGVLHYPLGIALSFNILFNLLMAAGTDPGSPQSISKSVLEQLDAEGDVGSDDFRPNFCKICSFVKPARTHHCSTCQRCVLRMDHHCPWLGQCVGLYNYRYFMLFMWNLLLGCIYCISLTVWAILDVIWEDSGYFAGDGPFLESLGVFSLTMGTSLAMSFMVYWHSYLIRDNQTTIEYYFEVGLRQFGRAPKYNYNLGFRNNFRYLFGYDVSDVRVWLLPTLYFPPLEEEKILPV